MEWLYFLGGLLLGSVIVFFLASQAYRSVKRESASAYESIGVSRQEDLKSYLEVLKREVSNEIMRRDFNRMREEYVAVLARQSELSDMSDEAKRIKKAQLIVKYPFFTDFDIAQVLHFVPYSEAYDWCSLEELCENYRDISGWLMMDEGMHEGKHSAEELEILDRTFERVEGEALAQLAIDAANRFFASWHSDDGLTIRDRYEDYDYLVETIYELGISPTSDTGIYLKSRNIYLRHEVFTFDNGDSSTQIYLSEQGYQTTGREIYYGSKKY